MNRNLTPYALGAIGVLLVGSFLQVIRPGLALVFVVIVILGMGQLRSRQNKTRHEEQLREWQSQSPGPEAGWQPPQPLARPPRSAWSAAGSLLAVLAAVGGLAMLGVIVMVIVMVSSGNFKLGNK
jgi:hypothetical protein